MVRAMSVTGIETRVHSAFNENWLWNRAGLVLSTGTMVNVKVIALAESAAPSIRKASNPPSAP